MAKTFLMACTGHIGFLPMAGIFKIFATFFVCSVLDYLSIKWSRGGGGGDNVTSGQVEER